MNHSKPLVWAMLGFGLALTLASCSSQENKAEKPAISVNSEKEIIQRGEYLVTTMGCNDCHSPKKMGPKGPEIIPELLLSGYPSDRPIVKFDSPLIKQGFAQLYPDLTAAAGPWGVSFAANLTPDESGIGNWTEDQFKMALTKGKFKGLDQERMLLPPMPWFNFVHLKDEDAHAMFQYLKSLKPVKNVVPSPISPDKM
ncbi:c-type cytochrome [Cytophagaceae bacterium 50C-KIRBA]|uniref:C-type cytochrome n=1 Tax=Aquirufa beregesia TaxID=2516556 RepID=A0ABX0ERK1_9BACT|nr:c-type cytochrome [Aquirufa beregesia]NGZ42859.1 c-type cytochrome [Aquirufa beregesia]